MQEYDITLKLLLRGSAKLMMHELAGAAVSRWLDVEFPKVENPRVDLLGELVDGSLIHLELQSTNEAIMPLRMAEYCLRVFRLFGQFPRQILLYVGEAPLRMASELRGARVSFEYQAVDIRDMDGDRLLESDAIGDNVIAILARLRDHKIAVRKIVAKIAGLAPAERDAALGQLVILAGLRRLGKTLEKEIRKMPVYIDILENEILAPAFTRGELAILRYQIEKRFGPVPAWAEERLANWPVRDLEDLGGHVLDAQSLEDLLK